MNVSVFSGLEGVYGWNKHELEPEYDVCGFIEFPSILIGNR